MKECKAPVSITYKPQPPVGAALARPAEACALCSCCITPGDINSDELGPSKRGPYGWLRLVPQFHVDFIFFLLALQVKLVHMGLRPKPRKLFEKSLTKNFIKNREKRAIFG